MTDPQTAYKRRDELRAQDHDRIASLHRWEIGLGLTILIAGGGAWVELATWRGEIEQRLGQQDEEIEELRAEDRLRAERMRRMEAADAAAAERAKAISERLDRFGAILIRIEDKLDRTAEGER